MSALNDVRNTHSFPTETSTTFLKFDPLVVFVWQTTSKKTKQANGAFLSCRPAGHVYKESCCICTKGLQYQVQIMGPFYFNFLHHACVYFP